jgi:hypothetical protein
VKKPTNVIKFKQRCLTPQQWMDRDIELPDTLLGDLFSTTSRILFSADTGLGKTMLGMAWAFALGLGQHFLHWRSIRKTARPVHRRQNAARSDARAYRVGVRMVRR